MPYRGEPRVGRDKARYQFRRQPTRPDASVAKCPAMSPGPVRVPPQVSQVSEGVANDECPKNDNDQAELDPEERAAALVRGWIRRIRTQEHREKAENDPPDANIEPDGQEGARPEH